MNERKIDLSAFKIMYVKEVAFNNIMKHLNAA